jgi:macrocin-O-methyltransferase TylF-like protien
VTGDNRNFIDLALHGHFGVNVPQRYSVNAERYAARGGLMRLAEDVRGFASSETNKADMARFYFFCLAFDQIVKEGIRGEFAELGVYQGHTASLLAIMARRLGTTAYLLDTFEGFDQADLKGIDANITMGFADTSIEAVRSLVGDRNVQFIPGHFPSSAAQLPSAASFCLVHLDCDLYAPMAAALEYFYPRLVPGGFLIVHDYSSLHWDGAERAVHEFFADKAESVVPLPDSAGSAVIRKTRPPSRYNNWYVRRNAALFGPEWVSAAAGNLATVLGEGWSSAEDWGVWGVDKVHQLVVFLGQPPERDIELQLDVSAMLLEGRTRREIAIFVGQQKIDTWIFSQSDNRSVRTLRITSPQLLLAAARLPAILVEFRPTLIAPAVESHPESRDTRCLGLALHRIRRSA